MKKELLAGLTEAQIERASKCKSAEELLAAAKEEDIKLTEEQLEAVNGGICVGDMPPRIAACPQCKEQVTGEYVETTPGDGRYEFRCPHCGYDWREKF